MTLDFNVDKIPNTRSEKDEKIELLGKFIASGKDCAKVNLFGKNAQSTASSFKRIIKERKLSVTCLVSQGTVFLVRRGGNV